MQSGWMKQAIEAITKIFAGQEDDGVKVSAAPTPTKEAQAMAPTKEARAMAEKRPIGHVFEIPNGDWPAGKWRKLARRYDYEKTPSKCPSCHGLGTIWHGCFRCLNCGCMALVDTGETFEPAPSA